MPWNEVMYIQERDKDRRTDTHTHTHMPSLSPSLSWYKDCEKKWCTYKREIETDTNTHTYPRSLSLSMRNKRLYGLIYMDTHSFFCTSLYTARRRYIISSSLCSVMALIRATICGSICIFHLLINILFHLPTTKTKIWWFGSMYHEFSFCLG